MQKSVTTCINVDRRDAAVDDPASLELGLALLAVDCRRSVGGRKVEPVVGAKGVKLTKLFLQGPPGLYAMDAL